MIYIGNHVSSSKGYEAMGKQEVALGGDTFAFFTRNPRGGSAKEIKDEDVQRLLTLMKDHSFGPLVAHAPYTMNVCAAKEDIRKFSVEMLKDDIRRMEYLPGAFYNFHPGSHVGQGSEAGAHKDRHQKLGLGKIGEEALRRVVTHPALQGRPFILETPNEDDGYAREIAMVRKWQEQ